MKKLLFLCLFTFIYTVSQAQTWAPIGAKWTFGTRDNAGPQQSFQNWTVTKDTLVKGQNCRFIKKTGYWTTSMRDLITYEDSGKVYLYHDELDTFHLLYDFNKNAGETWTIYKDTCAHKIRVDSTASETINGKALKVQYVSFMRHDTIAWKKEKIIAYIGHTKSNYHYDSYCSGSIADGPYTTSLRCYQDSVIGFYSTGIVPACEYVGLTETVEKPQFNIFPNPSTGRFTIQTQSIFSNSYICVRDVLGRIVLQQKLHFQSQDIDITGQPKGLYFVELRIGNSRSVQKLIVQ